jgi:hypothetical protein
VVFSKGQMERKLRRLESNLFIAVEAGAMIVEDTAQDFSPVWTGTMMRSVSHTPATREGDRIFSKIGPGPEAPYSKYTELLRYLITPSGKLKGLGPKSRRKSKARLPWLVPALGVRGKRITRLIISAYREAFRGD